MNPDDVFGVLISCFVNRRAIDIRVLKESIEKEEEDGTRRMSIWGGKRWMEIVTSESRRLFVAEGINTAIQLRRASAKKSSDIMLSTGTSGSSPRRLL